MKFKKTKEPKITMEEFTKLCAEPIDWEQRRYEIAKDAFILLCDIESREDYRTFNGSLKGVAEEAVRWADALIDELKK